MEKLIFNHINRMVLFPLGDLIQILDHRWLLQIVVMMWKVLLFRVGL